MPLSRIQLQASSSQNCLSSTHTYTPNTRAVTHAHTNIATYVQKQTPSITPSCHAVTLDRQTLLSPFSRLEQDGDATSSSLHHCSSQELQPTSHSSATHSYRAATTDCSANNHSTYTLKLKAALLSGNRDFTKYYYYLYLGAGSEVEYSQINSFI